jgi:hypothetical protein
VGVEFWDALGLDGMLRRLGTLSLSDEDSSLAFFLFAAMPFCLGVEAGSTPFFLGVDLTFLLDIALGDAFDESDGSLLLFLIGPVDLGLLLLFISCLFFGVCCCEVDEDPFAFPDAPRLLATDNLAGSLKRIYYLLEYKCISNTKICS